VFEDFRNVVGQAQVQIRAIVMKQSDTIRCYYISTKCRPYHKLNMVL